MRIGPVQRSVLIALLLAAPLVALDPSSVQQSAPLRRGNDWEQRREWETSAKDGGRLLVRADKGAVSVHAAAGNRVNCVVILLAHTADESEARTLFDKFELSARAMEAGGVYLSSESPRQGRRGTNFRVQFRITVPERYNLDVETKGGDITVDNSLQGEARLTTAGGDVRTGDVRGPVRIETAGGSIELGNVGSEVTARTAGGSIHVSDVQGDASLETSGGEIATGQVAGALRAETAGGDVSIGGGRQVVARTAGGQIQIGPTADSVRAETAGGSIRLQGARGHVVAATAGGSIDLLRLAGSVRATTAAGRILAEFNSTPKDFGPSRLESSMGDVYVYLPANVPLTIDAAIQMAAGRKIQSDFPLDLQGATESLVPTNLRGHGSLNGGGGVLTIRTVAGNIEIRRIDEVSRREMLEREQCDWQTADQRRAEEDRRRQQREQEQRER